MCYITISTHSEIIFDTWGDNVALKSHILPNKTLVLSMRNTITSHWSGELKRLTKKKIYIYIPAVALDCLPELGVEALWLKKTPHNLKLRLGGINLELVWRSSPMTNSHSI